MFLKRVRRVDLDTTLRNERIAMIPAPPICRARPVSWPAMQRDWVDRFVSVTSTHSSTIVSPMAGCSGR